MRVIHPDKLDLSAFVRPGDTVLLGQACGEPQTLTEALVAQRDRLGRVALFLGAGFSTLLQPKHADHLDFIGLGGVGSSRRLVQAGVMELLPSHISRLPDYLAHGRIPCDIVFVQVSGPDSGGRFSPATTNDYIRAAIRKARVVIAEINRQAPFTHADSLLTADEIDVAINTDRPLVSVPAARIGDVERRIATHVAGHIPDRAVLQMGIGAIPEAVMSLLGDRADLGIHSGMLGDSIVDLVERGIVTNAYKSLLPGRCVTGTLIGTERLFRFADRNPAILMAETECTHGPGALAQLAGLVSINSALEVDLTGQVNAEAVAAGYLGAVGGQLDYVRAAVASPGGRSVIALPGRTAQGGSRIVASLSGPVTTPRSDTDLVVTEWGTADLRGRTLAQRVRAMLDIADPACRDTLAGEARTLGLTG